MHVVLKHCRELRAGFLVLAESEMYASQGEGIGGENLSEARVVRIFGQELLRDLETLRVGVLGLPVVPQQAVNQSLVAIDPRTACRKCSVGGVGLQGGPVEFQALLKCPLRLLVAALEAVLEGDVFVRQWQFGAESRVAGLCRHEGLENLDGFLVGR